MTVTSRPTVASAPKPSPEAMRKAARILAPHIIAAREQRAADAAAAKEAS